MFQKEFYDGIPNYTVWRVLRDRLHLKAYKLSIAQGILYIYIYYIFVLQCSEVLL
jgi:hypothetical protein